MGEANFYYFTCLNYLFVMNYCDKLDIFE